jgi:hypothetical protein
MKAGAATQAASRPAMLRPAWIAGRLLIAIILGLGAGFGVHRLTAGSITSDLRTIARSKGV